MVNAERSAAVLEIQMLEFFAEALENVRPAILKRLLSASADGIDHGQLQKACKAIAAEAASQFERIIVTQGNGMICGTEGRFHPVAERQLAS